VKYILPVPIYRRTIPVKDNGKEEEHRSTHVHTDGSV
jgi:hypothetical protein